MRKFLYDIKDRISKPYNYQRLSIVVVSKSSYFSELSEDILLTLKKHNHDVSISDKFPKKFYDVFIVINPLFQFNERFRKNKRSLYVCMQTEQLNTPSQKGFKMFYRRTSFNGMKKILSRYDTIFDFSRENAYYLKTYFENVRHINYGYDEKYDNSNQKELEYDLIFIGDTSGVDNRRFRILNILKSKYKMYPNYSDVWGEAKYKAIAKSKIALNIHFDHSVVFESFRFFEYLSQKTFILTEFIIDSYPFVDGVDYISFHQDDLDEKIDYYLKNDKERDKIAGTGYTTARRFSRYNSISFMLHSIEIDLANKRTSQKKLIFAFAFFRFVGKIERIMLNLINRFVKS